MPLAWEFGWWMVATIVCPASASTLSFVTTASAMKESSPAGTQGGGRRDHVSGTGAGTALVIRRRIRRPRDEAGIK